jgi:hypothetical protein
MKVVRPHQAPQEIRGDGAPGFVAGQNEGCPEELRACPSIATQVNDSQ